MTTTKTNDISKQALIKKINWSAKRATSLTVRVTEQQKAEKPVMILTHAEIEYCTSVLPEIHPKLSLRGKAFIGGVIAREFTETERLFTVGKGSPASKMRGFRGRKTFEPKSQNTSKPLEVALESLNDTIYGRSADNQTKDHSTEIEMDFKQDILYIDKVIAETEELSAEISKTNKKYGDFLKTEPVKYTPHVVKGY